MTPLQTGGASSAAGVEGRRCERAGVFVAATSKDAQWLKFSGPVLIDDLSS